ncbi:endonuclease/exonuclease/phosphatase family protein [Actinokineospora soli]|uniref:Endonuclease/exonuclease/phosphatase family protein n=1 Tax=Actinokineospora soli TaxID=1048753 RepID=A0ABW2TN28_9PSEU
MGSQRRAALGIVLVLVTTGCRDDPAPPQQPDGAVTVVNLNAAMGFKMGRGDAHGTDATREDLELLADDILTRDADIANLQEMAEPAAHELRGILAEKTGAPWELNWSHSARATYYAGRDEDEPPAYDNVSAGNAQLIRIGDGIDGQEPITVDGDRPTGEPDQGIMLPSSKEPTSGRSFQGTELTTAKGRIDVYNLHLALGRDNTDEERARDVEVIQRYTESRTNPAVITGDFNQPIDIPAASNPLTGSPKTVKALKAFMETYGYTDVGRFLGPTSNRDPGDWKQEYKKFARLRIDYILANGVTTRDAKRFDSHESDHWGLAATIDLSAGLTTRTAVKPPMDPKRYHHDSYGLEFVFFTSVTGDFTCGIAKEQAVCQGQTEPVPSPPPGVCDQQGGPSWGHGMYVDPAGKVDFVCAGGILYWPSDGNPTELDVLDPGRSLSAFGFTCAGEGPGIRCAHDASGHGFGIAAKSNREF